VRNSLATAERYTLFRLQVLTIFQLELLLSRWYNDHADGRHASRQLWFNDSRWDGVVLFESIQSTNT
jgi:hypothetical protein